MCCFKKYDGAAFVLFSCIFFLHLLIMLYISVFTSDEWIYNIQRSGMWDWKKLWLLFFDFVPRPWKRKASSPKGRGLRGA
jgi:hypothetical protein